MCSCSSNLITISLDKTNTFSTFGSPRKKYILYEGCLGPDLRAITTSLTFKKGKKDAVERVESTDEIWLFISE